MTNPFFFLIVLTLASATSIANADDQTSAFLKTHCIRCHGSENQESDRRFDTLPLRIGSLADLERYQEIVDQLNLFEMPPEDELQPSDSERSKMISHLTQKISAAQAKFGDTGGHSVLRRLNSWEFPLN